MAFNKTAATMVAVVAATLTSLMACSRAPLGPTQASSQPGMPAPTMSPGDQEAAGPHARPSPPGTEMPPRDETGMRMDLFAFFAGHDDNLFVYDFKSTEVFAIPGAGSGVEHPMVLDMDPEDLLRPGWPDLDLGPASRDQASAG